MDALKRVKVGMVKAFEEAGLPCPYTDMTPEEKIMNRQILERRVVNHTMKPNAIAVQRVMDNIRAQYQSVGTNILKKPSFATSAMAHQAAMTATQKQEAQKAVMNEMQKQKTMNTQKPTTKKKFVQSMRSM